MAYAVTLQTPPGDPVEHEVLASSFSINEPLGGMAELTAEIVSGDGSYRPTLDDAVVVTEDGNTIFGGLVQDIQESGLGGPTTAITSRISAADYNGYIDQRVVNLTFAADTLDNRLDEIVTTCLSGFGVTLDPAQVEGPALPAVTYDYAKLSQVMAELVTLCGGAYVWRIDADKVLSMFAIGTVAAPFNIAAGDGNTIRDVIVKESRVSGSRPYANQVFVRGGTPEVPITAYADDLVEQAAHGLWQIMVSAPTATDATIAQALADELILQYPITPKTVVYQTLNAGLTPGMTQTINLPARNINNTFLITDIQTRAEGAILVRTVTAIEGSVYQGSWRDLYKQWSSGASQVVAVTPGPAAPGRYAYFLGGSQSEWVKDPTPTWVAASPMQVAIDTVARGTTTGTVTVRLRALSGNVTARLQNITDGATVGTSAAVTNTAWETTTFTVTLTAGSKVYRLELLPSVANSAVAAIGYLE